MLHIPSSERVCPSLGRACFPVHLYTKGNWPLLAGSRTSALWENYTFLRAGRDRPSRFRVLSPYRRERGTVKVCRLKSLASAELSRTRIQGATLGCWEKGRKKVVRRGVAEPRRDSWCGGGILKHFNFRKVRAL